VSTALQDICQRPAADAVQAADEAASRPVNVCFLIDELRTGGTETQLLRLIESFDRNRIRPHLCLLDGTSAASRRLEPRNCPVMRLGVRKLLSLRSIQKALLLGNALREWKIDVLQVHFPDSTYFGVPVAKWAGVPCIVRTRRDLFYWVTPVHRRWGRRLDQLYNRYLVDAMVVNSETVKQAAVRHERPAPNRIDVIPNGVDLTDYPRDSAVARSDRAVRIGLLSMLRPEKRPELFVEAARRVSDRFPAATFQIAGDGPERSRVESLIDQLALKNRVALLGAIDKVPAFLAGLDIAVLCSATEGLSNAIVEYMAAGLPIIATAVGGNLELLQHRETALIVSPGNDVELADAMVELIERPQLRKQLGARARMAVAESFELRTVTRRYENFYHELIHSVDSRRRRSQRR